MPPSAAPWLEDVEVIVVRQVAVLAERESRSLCGRGLRATAARPPLYPGLADLGLPPGLCHRPVLALQSAAAITVGPTAPAGQEVLGSVLGLRRGGRSPPLGRKACDRGTQRLRPAFQPAPSPLDRVRADVGLRGAALVPAGASAQAPQGQGEPQGLPEVGARALGLLPLPGDEGDGLLQLEDAGVGALQRPVFHHDELGGDGILAHDAELELQEADALLCQVIGTQDHDHPAAPLNEVEHCFSGI